jgi:hypothetical protein
MNEVLMSIYLKHHLMPYAIHETRRHPRNVRLWVLFSIQRKFLKRKKRSKREPKEEGSFQMTTKAATAIAQ